jgi:ligand-binding sensor domain-containing protein
MHGALVALLGWLLRAAFTPSPAALLDETASRWIECPVPAGPALAAAALSDGRVVVRDGALELHGAGGVRVVTTCEGLPGPYPTAVAVAEGRVVVGFRAQGLWTYADGRFERVPGLPEDAAVRALAADGPRVWIGTGNDGLWHVDPGAKAVRVVHPVLRERDITALAAHDGVVEVGAGVRGWWRVEAGGRVRRVERGVFVGCFVPNDEGFQAVAPGPGCAVDAPLAADSGLPSAHVTALAVHEGSLYVGTFDGGLARRAGGRFVPVEGAPRFVNALLSDGDRLWIGTTEGLFVLRDGRVTKPALGLPGDHVNSLALGADGTLWVATGEGLLGVNGGRVRVLDERAGLPARIVHSVAVTADGAVWAGTLGGVARLGPDGVQVFTQAGGALPHDWATALLPDGDDVIVGTYDAGLARLGARGGAPLADAGEIWVNPNGLARVGDALVVSTLGDGLVVRRGGRTAALRAGLPSDDVTAVAVSGGAVWIGTRGGLVRWAAKPGET